MPAGPDAAGVTWLCRPGLAGDPCLYPRGANVVAANGAKTAIPAAARRPSPPSTVSTCIPRDRFGRYVQHGDGGDAGAGGRSGGTGVSFLPGVQRVGADLPPADQRLAGRGPGQRSGGRPDLLREPAGRLEGLPGPRQRWSAHCVHRALAGAANLIRLLRSQVDGNPALRDRMVSAIILGGNVQVPVGKTVGGTFAHIPACTKASQTGCVIAYSSFSSPPPADSLFGRPGQGVSLQSGQKTERGQQVVCTNPAALGATGAAR